MKKILFSFVSLVLLAIVPVGASAESACVSGDLFNRLTGERCATISVVPGCLPGYNFSPITGQRCPIGINPPICYAYAHLTVGSNGAEVVELQGRLVSDGYLVMPAGVARGYFGNLTAEAVTRARINGLYRCGIVQPGNQSPVISGVSGPTALRVGEQGTWTVRASDPENGNLSYSVIWGDEATENVYGGTPSASLSYTQTATFTHTYNRIANSSGTTYTPTFFVRDSAGNTASAGLSVKVGGAVANQPTVRVISPNGGENWLDHGTANIVWDPIGCAGCQYFARYNPAVDIYLGEFYPPCTGQICPMYAYRAPYVLDKNITRSNSSYGWIVATDINDRQIPAGKYKVQICVAGSTTDCDWSDNYFTIFQAQAY